MVSSLQPYGLQPSRLPGFSRQEYWSRLPCPSPEDLPDPGIEPRSLTLQADAFTSEPSGKPWHLVNSQEMLLILIAWFTLIWVQFSHSVMSDSLRPHGLQHTKLPCLSPTPRACSNSCPSSWWCHPTISFSIVTSPPVFNLSQHQGLFQWISSSHQVAKVLEFQFQHQSFQWYSGLISFRIDWLDLSAVKVIYLTFKLAI